MSLPYSTNVVVTQLSCSSALCIQPFHCPLRVVSRVVRLLVPSASNIHSFIRPRRHETWPSMTVTRCNRLFVMVIARMHSVMPSVSIGNSTLTSRSSKPQAIDNHRSNKKPSCRAGLTIWWALCTPQRRGPTEKLDAEEGEGVHGEGTCTSCPLPSQLGVSGALYKLLNGIRGGDAAENGFDYELKKCI